MSAGMAKLFVRVVVVGLVASVLVLAGRDFVVASETVVPKRAEEVAGPVDREVVFRLPFAAQHVALHWPGHREAGISVATSRDGELFDAPVVVQLDEVGEGHPNGETYGALMAAQGATHVRVVSDRPLGRVSVLALVDGEPQVVSRRVAGDEAGAAGTAQPTVISRAGWEADESLRFRRNREVWPPTFHRVQKLVVHHTATANVDTIEKAKAEIRSMYYYHAVTQGWGDIGYNFIVDELGNLYEGRYAREYAAGEVPTGEDANGRVVTAGHTYQHNVGTVGVAVLGTFTDRAPLQPAQDKVVDFLAWESARHHLDPDKTATYRNVVNDLTRDVTNIAGHRDYVATACPGDKFYPLLGQVRASVVSAVGNWDGDVIPPPAPSAPTAVGGRRTITLSWAASPEAWPAQSGIAYYEIERRSTANAAFAVIDHTDDRTLTYTDSGVRGEYSYQVIAVDGAGNRGTPSPVATGRAT